MRYSTNHWGKSIHYTWSILLATLVLVTGCKTISVPSTWTNEKPVIDGLNQEWHNALTLIDGENVSIGVRNDSTHLYLAIITGDGQNQQQAIMRGFIVWFDSTGGKGKSFGIKYPYGVAGGGFPMQGRGTMGRHDRNSREQDKNAFARFADYSLKRVEILGAEKEDGITFAHGEVNGLEMSVGNMNGTFVYELQIPLAKDLDHSYAIGRLEKGELGIGLEIPELDRESMREEMEKSGRDMSGGRGGGMGGRGGGRGGMGGRGGGRGGMGGRGGGMRGGGRGMAQRPDTSSPLKTWIKVQLSEPASAISG